MSGKELLYESSLRIGYETVQLRFFKSRGGFVFERETMEKDGTTLIQTLPFNSLEILNVFVLADPFFDNFGSMIKKGIELICKAYDSIPSLSRAIVATPINSYEEIIGAISRIKDCQGEFELHELLDSIFPFLGVKSYLFTTVHREAGLLPNILGPMRYRFLIGCNPAFPQMYIQRRWYAIARVIRYPLLGSEFIPESQGQKDMNEAIKQHGFLSSMSVPAVGVYTSIAGILFVGNDNEVAVGEKKLRDSQPLLRVIALEMLEWQQDNLKAMQLAKLNLSKVDVALLKLVRDGYTAEDAALELDLTVSQVNHKFRRINTALSVSNKKEAVERVTNLGILD